MNSNMSNMTHKRIIFNIYQIKLVQKEYFIFQKK